MKTTNLIISVCIAPFVSVCIIVLPAHGQSNLLVNGNFELGNVGFSSAYTYSPGNIIAQGTYDLVSNPHNDHPDATSFGDHTTGTGLMMAVNGAADPSQIVWSETVPVATNMTYFLSGWGASWGGGGVDPAPAQLVFYINGTQLGSPVQIPATNAIWQSFTTLWNSEGATQAVIEIHDVNTIYNGNDFALDDLTFAAVSTNSPPLNIYQSVEINWTSTSNTTYQVQWAPSLPATNWFNLGNAVTAVSTNTSVWDRVGWGARFYRIQVFQ